MRKRKAKQFHLNVYGHEGFSAGADAECKLGDVWEGDLRTNAKEPYKAGSTNNTRVRHLDLDKVSRVYLRKQSRCGGDNTWDLSGAEVTL
jgi:hypothetical protein